MKIFLRLSRVGAIAAVIVGLGLGAAYAQATTPEVVNSAPGTAVDAPITAWGDPDLQGIWVGSTLTPMERPAEFEGKEFLSEEEIAGREEAARACQFQERATTAGDTGTYNAIWFDRGTAWVPSRRTSLIVEPPGGRIPYTATARQHERPYGIGPYDSHVDLDTGERCLGDGLPQIWFGYNPNHQIFQTQTHVVIVHEMFKQRRIIPLDGGPQCGHAPVERRPPGTVGGQHACGGVDQFLRPARVSVGQHLASSEQHAARGRAVHPGRCHHHRLRGHDYRPRALRTALDGSDAPNERSVRTRCDIWTGVRVRLS